MPPKRAVEDLKSTEVCMLQYGKNNNTIKWKEHMQTMATELYGIVGMFFTTNVRYEQPRITYRDYPPDSSSESSSSESEPESPDKDQPVPDAALIASYAREKAKRGAARESRNDRRRKSSERSRTKYREDDYIQRKRDVKSQKENERTLYPLIWRHMSLSSQTRVSEEEEFQTAYLTLDPILLWTLIRKTHLTHPYGDDDPMMEVNQHLQESKYASMRQGEREHIVTFKARFDEQVAANKAVGMAEVTDSKRALDFLGKLDPRRYKVMHDDMKNDALRRKLEAFPTTLAAAFRISSGWHAKDSTLIPTPGAPNAAYVTDSAHVTMSKDPTEKKAGKTPGGPKKKQVTEVECFLCEEKGHYARNCPLRKSGKEKVHVSVEAPDDDDESGQDEWGIALVATAEKCHFSRFDVLLDNEASLNIFNNSALLTGLRKAQKPIKVSGIELGAGVTVDHEGDFGELGTVFYSESASANILSFASQVDAGAAITYDTLADHFTLQPKGSEQIYRFGRKQIEGSEGRFYSCDWRDVDTEAALVTTVVENSKGFTKREIERARQAREMLARMGFPTVEQAMSIVNAGSNFEVTARDFQIADAIWGKDIASMKGKTCKRATAVADVVVSTKIVQRDQVLSIDIMFIDKIAILIGVATPLGLTIAYSLNNIVSKKSSRAVAEVRKGINHFLAVLASQNFRTSLIMSDGEGAVVSLVDELGKVGVEVDISGAGGHVARIERRIRVIKERVRAHVAHHLPFTLSTVGIAMCVLYCVSRLNYEPAGLREWGPSPREAFIGRKPDGKRDFRCSFGDYAQCTVPNTDSTLKSRTEDCVVMLPLGNRTGTVRMLSLASGRLVNRDQFRILPMPESVIKRLNALALADGRIKGKGELATLPTLYEQDGHERRGLPDMMDTVVNNGIDPSTKGLDSHDYSDIIDDVPIEQDHHENGATHAAPDLIEPVYYEDAIAPVYPPGKPKPVDMDDLISSLRSMDAGRFGRVEDSDETVDAHGIPVDYTAVGGVGDTMDRTAYTDLEASDSGVETQRRPRMDRHDFLNFFRSGRGGAALLARNYDGRGEDWGDYVFNISVNEALRTRGDAAVSVIEKELSQMLSKKVWSPVDLKGLSWDEKHRIIRSSMFLKEKFLASGEFEKLKARLVAGGDQQDRNLYDDLSAPTVGTSSVFTLLSIAAHEQRSITVIDITGAFLNADMTTGLAVHMRLDRKMTDMIVRIAPEYSGYRDDKGCVVVRLDKALYGCVESAALWYENLKESLGTLGYVANTHDICVFNKRDEHGVQCTVAVHVDDLFITSTNGEMIESLAAGLIKRYGDITRKNGPIVNYLGMVFDVTIAGVARVSMSGYVEDMLKESKTVGGARTPATEGLFDVRGGAEVASEERRVWFHRHVAKLLYLAKRARPDCLTAVAYLATRVTKCSVDDLAKLERLLKYVCGTRDRGVVFAPGNKGIEVSVLIDAAYGVHPDGKSHTGSCVVVGERGAVHCKSAKQQIVTKSSTEAELVALSDSSNQALHLRNFIIGQGHLCGPVTVYQDNMSCMSLIERGRSAAERTRHIAIKYFWLKERVDMGEARVKHLGTREMYANLLTKPLQGAQFKSERFGITGWEDDTLV